MVALFPSNRVAFRIHINQDSGFVRLCFAGTHLHHISKCSRLRVFHWFYKVFRSTMLWIREPRGGSSPRPGFPGGSQGEPLFYQGFSMGVPKLEMLFFHWFYKVFKSTMPSSRPAPAGAFVQPLVFHLFYKGFQRFCRALQPTARTRAICTTSHRNPLPSLNGIEIFSIL